ncbi:MAG: chitobiase/beta-hexosaminidase C-terminal domain-containing protein [Desulfobacterales bacterium]|nr:chitobiase/beta-hexosaminidase C-terminal domain-containing protein [Desulfobacterales bacterium]
MKNNKVFSIFLMVTSMLLITIEAHSADLEISGETATGNYYSAESIYTDEEAGCWVNSGSDVQFVANDTIILKSGFYAHAGSSFKTLIREVDPLDMDANTLPDAWELQYFGHLENDPDFDSDGDGFTNFQEYEMGSAPNNSASVPAPIVTFNADPQITDGLTSATLAWTTLYADSISIEPGPGDVTGQNTTDVFPESTTEYILTATGNGGITTATFTVIVDSESPQIISSYPTENGTFNAENLQMGLVATFVDNTGISSVTLFKIDGQQETDVTALAVIGDNAINFDISNLEDGIYNFKLVIIDDLGNQLIHYFTFTIDKTFPVTSPSIAAGAYKEPFSLDLVCSEPATIFYSTDGSPPFEGGANTISGTSPIPGININRIMCLQFYAKDAAGNIEPVKRAMYLAVIPDAVTGVTGQYNNPNVDITWAPFNGADKYRVYRALSAIDHNLLVQSGKDGYAPPGRLLYCPTDLPASTTSFVDTNVMPGVTYYYGVTQVDSNGTEGVIGQLVSVPVPETGTALNKEEAITRALAWLESKQDKTGFWGETPGTRILATSQVLNAYKLAEIYDYNTSCALFYLRGHRADNNDYLARKIRTLSTFNQNADMLISKLVSQASFVGIYLQGWALNTHYAYDPLDTVLGKKAIDCHSSDTISNYAAYKLKNNENLQSSIPDRFAWIIGSDPSIYVSSLVYQVVDDAYPADAPVFNSSWITGSQAPDGSFGNRLVDTSAVLIWLNYLDESQKQNAITYLISQQKPNGSWGNDPYLTGLCLEALLK